MFVIIDLQTVSYTQCIGMLLIYLHARFHIPISSISSNIAIKPWAKRRFYAAAILLFHVRQKNYHNINYCLFWIYRDMTPDSRNSKEKKRKSIC
jgi:hypothetical protein